MAEDRPGTSDDALMRSLCEITQPFSTHQLCVTAAYRIRDLLAEIAELENRLDSASEQLMGEDI